MAVERTQKIENLSTALRAKVGQSSPKSQKMPNFKPPYLPQMGADSPQTKTIFLKVARAVRGNGQFGGCGPKTQKCPTPPNFDPHCSNSTNLIFTKFSASLEHPRACRTPSRNRKSVDRVPSKSRPKFAKIPKFKPPYLPQMGADSPQTKTIFFRLASPMRCKGQMVGAGPKRG